MSEYAIRVTRIRYEVLDKKEEEEHYYRGKYNDRPAYRLAYSLDTATRITEQKFREVAKEIELIYEKNLKNGILLKIEVVDINTLKPIYTIEPKPEPEIITSRFELMEFLDE